MKDYDQEIFNEFGLVVYDEVHHVASKVFSQALMKTSGEYTLGLSATPERSDGLFKVIKWHIGDILYFMEKKIDYRVLVKKIYFRSEDALFIEKKRWFQGRMAPNHTTMIDNIAKIQSRNKLIINMINTLKNLGRKILILSYRVEHLVKLKSMIDIIIQNDGEQHIYNTYFYMGDTKKGERKMAEKDGDIIFATMQLAEEGLDIAHLDTILFALPVSIQKEKGSKNIKSDKTLIQSVGRILRNDKLNELTQIPLVIDISDILSIYQGWSRKRDEVYERKNWYVQSYHYADYDYIYGSDQLTDKNPMNIIFDDITDEEFIEKNLITTKKEIDEHEKDSELSADDNVSNKSNSSIPEDVFTATKIKKNKELKDKELKDKELKDNESINQLLDEKSNLIGDSIIDKKKNKKSKKNTITII
jgi:superfamily II DNA or RNA helicase